MSRPERTAAQNRPAGQRRQAPLPETVRWVIELRNCLGRDRRLSPGPRPVSISTRITVARQLIDAVRPSRSYPGCARVWPSASTIAKATGLHERTVRAAIDALEALGYASRVPPPGTRSPIRQTDIWLSIPDTAELYEQLPLPVLDVVTRPPSTPGSQHTTPGSQHTTPGSTPADLKERGVVERSGVLQIVESCVACNSSFVTAVDGDEVYCEACRP